MDKRILDIGCGPYKIKWATWLDSIKMKWVDIVHNLEKYPYPIKDSTFDEIHGQHIIEHIKDLIPFMQELCRIAKPWARIIFRAPHASCSYSSRSDPTHIRPFTTQTFKYFEDDNMWAYYSNTRIRVIKTKLHYICYNGERWSRVPKFLHRFLTWLANLNHLFCERVWAWWFGWFEEVYIELLVTKK